MRTINPAICLALLVAWSAAAAQVPAPPTVPQTEPVDWRAERAALETIFAEELQTVAQWCRETGLPQQVEPTLALSFPRDLNRQYIYLPQEGASAPIPEGPLGGWLEKIQQARQRHAQRLWDLADRAARAGQGAVAYQLLHEVVHQDADHGEARRALGHVARDGRWYVAPSTIRIRDTKRAHEFLQWPAGQYVRALSPHFEIESNAAPDRIEALAAKLELWHAVWRQVFFDYWSSPDVVQRWMEGPTSARMSSKRFRVIFFANRQEYLRELGPRVRGIEVSTGYYANADRVSFFYDGGAREQETWRHELTHQLFRESGRSREDAFEDQFIWLDEGIATYFESLTEFGDYVTLGGFEARRLQYARLRRLLEGYHIPLAQLSDLGRTQLQGRADIARLYSQAAGLTDMLINDRHGTGQQRLTEFLRLIYKGRVKPHSFETILGKSFAEFDERYPEYLQVDPQAVVDFLSQPESRTELCLSGTELTVAGWESLGRCRNLQWLDVSGNRLDRQRLQSLQPCQQLNQLILTRCRLEPQALHDLAQLGQLQEVDLSESDLADGHLAACNQWESVVVLRLAGTQVTDQCVDALLAMPHLQQLDVSATALSAGAIARLRQRPGLKVIH